jgi:peptidoglycan L-alanyl-D-glutamate endopeptidase CwlK
MDAAGFPMFVSAGSRTFEEQFALFAKGRKLENGIWVPINPQTRAGIVTNADGKTRRSNHQLKDDGLGYAFDMAFLVDGPDHDDELDTPSFDESHPWDLYGELGKAFGNQLIAGTMRLVWGGDWPELRDRPHFELRLA